MRTTLLLLFTVAALAGQPKAPPQLTNEERLAIENVALKEALLQNQYAAIQQAKKAVEDAICTARKLEPGCAFDLRTGTVVPKPEAKQAAKEAAK